MKKLFSLLVGNMMLFSSCDKPEFTVEQLIGDWRATEHRDYEKGETPPAFNPNNCPYVFLNTYASGMTLRAEHTWCKAWCDSVGVLIPAAGNCLWPWEFNSKDNQITLNNTAENKIITADIIELTEELLWIKYSDGNNRIEYKLVRN